MKKPELHEYYAVFWTVRDLNGQMVPICSPAMRILYELVVYPTTIRVSDGCILFQMPALYEGIETIAIHLYSAKSWSQKPEDREPVAWNGQPQYFQAGDEPLIVFDPDDTHLGVKGSDL